MPGIDPLSAALAIFGGILNFGQAKKQAKQQQQSLDLERQLASRQAGIFDAVSPSYQAIMNYYAQRAGLQGPNDLPGALAQHPVSGALSPGMPDLTTRLFHPDQYAQQAAAYNQYVNGGGAPGQPSPVAPIPSAARPYGPGAQNALVPGQNGVGDAFSYVGGAPQPATVAGAPAAPAAAPLGAKYRNAAPQAAPAAPVNSPLAKPPIPAPQMAAPQATPAPIAPPKLPAAAPMAAPPARVAVSPAAPAPATIDNTQRLAATRQTLGMAPLPVVTPPAAPAPVAPQMTAAQHPQMTAAPAAPAAAPVPAGAKYRNAAPQAQTQGVIPPGIQVPQHAPAPAPAPAAPPPQGVNPSTGLPPSIVPGMIAIPNGHGQLVQAPPGYQLPAPNQNQLNALNAARQSAGLPPVPQSYQPNPQGGEPIPPASQPAQGPTVGGNPGPSGLPGGPLPNNPFNVGGVNNSQLGIYNLNQQDQLRLGAAQDDIDRQALMNQHQLQMTLGQRGLEDSNVTAAALGRNSLQQLQDYSSYRRDLAANAGDEQDRRVYNYMQSLAPAFGMPSGAYVGASNSAAQSGANASQANSSMNSLMQYLTYLSSAQRQPGNSSETLAGLSTQLGINPAALAYSSF